jgi:hypothetical protein
MTDNAGLKGAALIAAEQVASTKNVRIKLDPKRVKAALDAEDICRDAGRKVAMEAAIRAYLSAAHYDMGEIDRLRSQLYHATVAVDSVHDHALEEAAQVAEASSSWRPEVIAAAIRALKETD